MSAATPARVVAMGGGTGLPVMLRGLRRLLPNCRRSTLTAVVTMTDDGGSSGRLRRSLGVPPPGDLRNCLVALSEREDLIAGLFQHRYADCEELGGHSLGNLILAALAEQTGSFVKAVEMSSLVLRTVGRILPATLDGVVLTAKTADGREITGETTIDADASPIERLWIHPAEAQATPGVIDAILEARLVVLGPGSLYTSIVPNLIVPGVAEALKRSDACVVLVANLVSESVTRRMQLVDHLRFVERHLGAGVVDALVVNDGQADPDVLARYAAEGQRPLVWDDAARPDVDVVRAPLLADDYKLRHDPIPTAEGVLKAWRRWCRRRDAKGPVRGVRHVG